MTGEPVVEIVIDKSGGVRLAVKGARGASCLALTEALEKALGVVVSREHTAEYYQIASVQDNVQVKRT